MASARPYYRKWLPPPQSEADSASDGRTIDISAARLPEGAHDRLRLARLYFHRRAAAAIRAAAGLDGHDGDGPPRIWPTVGFNFVLAVGLSGGRFDRAPDRDEPWFEARDLLELKWYGNEAPTIHIPRSKCLALLAYEDYFPANPRLGQALRLMVSRAVLSAASGWAGTFGPGADGSFSLEGAEGNYDMSEMHLLPMVYRHYHDLTPAARERLITQLLACGRVHRPNVDDTFTSRGNPNDWNRAGFISPLGYHISIGETENHILMIQTARYLTNQLLFQRERDVQYDNRRNGGRDRPSCYQLLLMMLRNFLVGDFSEYNAKSYQSETRWALLNLCTYAYDHEVRLGARLVLDYLSARFAVSTNDLRRMVPFRRRFTDVNAARTASGVMQVGLLTGQGADPMAPYLAMQAGNTRAFRLPTPLRYEIADPGTDLAMEVLSDYRMPPLIQDLFVNDQHRRFFQRVHRRPRNDVGGGRNCDNMEIYASSPSYLITAGGAPAPWAVDPSLHAMIDGEAECQQLGVAVTTSFIPTGFSSNSAGGIIQLGSFSTKIRYDVYWKFLGIDVAHFNYVVVDKVQNYGVAPDFACGAQLYLPSWVGGRIVEGVRDGVPQNPRLTPGFSFVNVAGTGDRDSYSPGFYLAIYQEWPGGFAVMEAFDTWLHPGVTFSAFKASVLERNGGLRISNNTVTRYVTHNGNRLDFVVWTEKARNDAVSGAQVLRVEHAPPDFGDLGDAIDAIGSAERITDQLVNGTVLNERAEGHLVISNFALGAQLTLDFSDAAHPRRADSLTGEAEVAGFGNEVWLDFDYRGPIEGDVCRPFGRLADAIGSVAEGGTVRIVPGYTEDRPTIGGGKRFTLVAPAGGVAIGTTDASPPAGPEYWGELSNRDLWVQFDWPRINQGNLPWVYATLAPALLQVADGGTIYIEPGSTGERLIIGAAGRHFTIAAPLGGVTLGGR